MIKYTSKILLLLMLSSHLYAQKLPLFFEGFVHLSERELYKAINLEKPYSYEFYKKQPVADAKSATLFTQVIENYYRTKGFYHAEVSYKTSEKSIVISIVENEPVRIERISIDSKLDIISVLSFKKNDFFDADAFTQSKKDIKVLYSKNHYCNISLDAKAYVDTQKNSANIIYKIVPNELCFIKNIEVNASKNIDADIAKSLLHFQEEDLFNLESIRNSYQNMYAYDGISKALIQTKIEDNTSVNIKLLLHENEKPIRFIAGLGISSDEGLMVQTGIEHRNYKGNLKTLGVHTKLTQVKQTLKGAFNMPLLNKNSLGLEVGLENEIFDGFTEYRLFSAAYLTQRYMTHSFKESLVLDRSSTYKSKDLTVFPEGVLLVVSPKFEWNYDTRDSLLDARSGYFLSGDIMGSLKSVISDASYVKAKLKGAYLYPLKSSTLGVKVTLGALHVYEGQIPASYRFFAGGMHSNRAYSYRDLGTKNAHGDAIGFDSITETTFEYRFDVYGNFRAVLFSDNTFISNTDVPDYDKGYHSGGVGLRYISPIGPIAIDIGFDLNKPRSQFAVHFHIGELF